VREPLEKKRQREYAEELLSKKDDGMTLCIAGECRHKGMPALVLIADSRAERGLSNPVFSEFRIGSEDTQKIRDVGRNFRALVSGAPTLADELLAKCDTAIVKLEDTAHNEDSDIVITEFFENLRQAARLRKRELVEHYIGMNTVLGSRDEFLTKSREVFSEAHYNKLQDEIKGIGLGGDIIIAGFHGETPLIVRLDSGGEVHWEDHYSVVGAGSDIAFAILALNPYDEDEIEVPECVFRLFEAKSAAQQTNKTVGNSTVFEVLVRNQETQEEFEISDEFFELMKTKLRFLSIPTIDPPTKFLLAESDTEKETEKEKHASKDSAAAELIQPSQEKHGRFIGRFRARDSMPEDLEGQGPTEKIPE
jgi:hypothetical protein